MQIRKAILFLATSLVVIGTTNGADASETRVTLFGFNGYKGSVLSNAIERSLGRTNEIVDWTDVMDAAEELGADVASPDGFEQISNELGISLFIRGTIRGKGRRARTSLVIYGSDGAVLAKGRGRSPKTKRGRRKLAKLARRLTKKAIAALDAADELDDAEVDEEDVEQDGAFEDESEPRPKRVVIPKDEGLSASVEGDASEPEMETRSVNRRATMGFSSTPRDEIPEPEVDADDEDPQDLEVEIEGPRTSKTKKFDYRLHGGLIFRSRNATLTLNNGRSPRHRVPLYPELGVGLYARPFSKRGSLKGAFLDANISFAVGVSSIDRATDVSTSSLRLLVSGGYLVNFGALDVGGIVGLGFDRIGLADNSVLDSSGYAYARLGGLARLGLFGNGLELRADLGVRPVFSSGGIASRYGQSGGGVGYDLGLGFLHNTDLGVSYGLVGGYQAYAFSFGSKDSGTFAERGADQSVVVTMHLGWNFR